MPMNQKLEKARNQNQPNQNVMFTAILSMSFL